MSIGIDSGKYVGFPAAKDMALEDSRLSFGDKNRQMNAPLRSITMDGEMPIRHEGLSAPAMASRHGLETSQVYNAYTLQAQAG